MGSLQITLACDLGGITLYHPAKPAPDEAHMFMLIDDPKPEAHDDTTIYWQELTGTAQTTPGLESTYREWEMWIQEIGENNELLDPLHCTLNITHEQDLTYDEPWYNQKDGQLEIYTWDPKEWRQESTSRKNNYLGSSWNQSVPHVSLLVSADHQPKQLGPMAIGRRVDGHRMMIDDNNTRSDDPEDPEVNTMLSRIKETVWANGPYEV
ncbi:unnamed protein product [Arctogadus glacialis]